jgi:crotonobetainyl-CoA:carnitine CoA-transferase CaiB-like acyl-CoA transferase
MTIDLRRPEGVDIFKRLIAITDIFLESNAAGTMDRMGIGYEELKKVKPDLIMFSIPGMGSTGPKKHYVGFGAHMEGLFGHTYLRGYHDTDPTSTTIVFHYDPAVGATVAFVAVMALHQRNKTGKGQYFDMAGAEAAMPQLGEIIMDYTMNRRIGQRFGNRHPTATQGCYLCKGALPSAEETPPGDDKWINITINNDEEWAALCRVMGRPELIDDERFADVVTRRKNQDEFDKVVGEWTRNHDKYALMFMLQAKGVPAGAVLDQRDCFSDPQIMERGFFEELTQAECGTHLYPGLAWRMSKTPNHLRTPPCMLGEHNEYVYKQLLGVSDEEYAELERKGHIQMDFDDDIM